MNFILIIGIVYLYLKYRDMSKELFNINNHLESLDINVERIDDYIGNDVNGEV